MLMPVSTCSGELPNIKSLFLMCLEEKKRTSSFFQLMYESGKKKMQKNIWNGDNRTQIKNIPI